MQSLNVSLLVCRFNFNTYTDQSIESRSFYIYKKIKEKKNFKNVILIKMDKYNNINKKITK